METNTLRVPGARLRYALQGRGRLLLVVPGGDGDIAASDDLAARLADRYTVLRYDRRGLSGSTIDDPAVPAAISTHAEDVHRLLAEVTSKPAYVYGSSIGAIICLELAARHPEQVHMLVAHEPPATQLLPEPQRAKARRAQQEIEEAHRADGAGAAMRKFAVLAGIDPTDREPEVQLRPPGPQRQANLEFFLGNDAPSVRQYRLDLPALKAASTRIVPAVGETSAHIWPHDCGRLLAEALGTPCVTFPGGHNGASFRPGAFAERLHEVLQQSG